MNTLSGFFQRNQVEKSIFIAETTRILSFLQILLTNVSSSSLTSDIGKRKRSSLHYVLVCKTNLLS